MKEPIEISSLRKVAASLEKDIDRKTELLDKLNNQREALVHERSEVRRKWASVMATIKVLGGDTGGHGTPSLEDILEGILSRGGYSLSDLQDHAQAHGFSRHAVRKALNGISFARNTDGKYVLRESLYTKREEAAQV